MLLNTLVVDTSTQGYDIQNCVGVNKREHFLFFIKEIVPSFTLLGDDLLEPYWYGPLERPNKVAR
jgi:hypothetical protein